MRRGAAPSVSSRTHGHHRSAHHPRLAMQIRRCDQEYATGTLPLSFKQNVAHEAVVAHVLATFHRMFRTYSCACCAYLSSGVTSSRQLGPTGGAWATPPTQPPKGLTCTSKGPSTHPSRRTHHLSREPCRQARTRGRGQRRQRGRQRNHPQRPGSINPFMRSWALQVEHGQPRPHRPPRG